MGLIIEENYGERQPKLCVRDQTLVFKKAPLPHFFPNSGSQNVSAYLRDLAPVIFRALNSAYGLSRDTSSSVVSALYLWHWLGPGFARDSDET